MSEHIGSMYEPLMPLPLPLPSLRPSSVSIICVHGELGNGSLLASK